jgi:acetyl-CoA C-acetyltransferase
MVPRLLRADDPDSLAHEQGAVAFRGLAEHVQDFLPMSKRDILKFEGCAEGLESAP